MRHRTFTARKDAPAARQTGAAALLSPAPRQAVAASGAASLPAPTLDHAGGIPVPGVSGQRVPAAGTPLAWLRRTAARTRNAKAPAGMGKAALTAGLFAGGLALCLATGTSVAGVMDGFSFNVLVILVTMELFTGMLAQTGAMEALAIKLAVVSRGRRAALTALLGAMMFLVSSILNNITAILVVLPCVFVLLRALEPDRRYLTVLFAVILAVSNLGGAATGVGDLPAVLIVQSGVVSFAEYTLAAFPFFAASTAVLVGFWMLALRVGHARRENPRAGVGQPASVEQAGENASARLAIGILESQYAHIGVDWKTLAPLAAILGAMIVAWMAVPASVVPSDVIAVAGCACTLVAFKLRGGSPSQVMDMGNVLTIASFLFIAACISATGALDVVVGTLRAAFPDDGAYLAAVLALTSLLAGLVGAGPAAACCLPIVCNLATTVFAANRVAVMVAYGAAICAGSSLFLWSATAGFILSGKIEGSRVRDDQGRPLRFGIGEYFKYGLANYAIQLALALVLTALAF